MKSVLCKFRFTRKRRENDSGAVTGAGAGVGIDSHRDFLELIKVLSCGAIPASGQ